MGVFVLKSRDTRPILEVVLLNPDGSVHDLTGSASYTLHIKGPTGVISRAMALHGTEPEGTLSYTWVAADWSDLPLVSAGKTKELTMEYEVIGGLSRMSFPNGGYDTLRIVGDIGQE